MQAAPQSAATEEKKRKGLDVELAAGPVEAELHHSQQDEQNPQPLPPNAGADAKDKRDEDNTLE